MSTPDLYEDYRLFVDKERIVMVRFWKTGEVEVALRKDERDIWSPPIALFEES